MTHDDRRTVHDIVHDELCRAEVCPEWRTRYPDIVERLRADGAEGVILGCAGIGLLIEQNDLGIPVFDSLEAHAAAVVEAALAD